MKKYTQFTAPHNDPRCFPSYWCVDSNGNKLVFDNFTGQLLWSILTLNERVRFLEDKLEEASISGKEVM